MAIPKNGVGEAFGAVDERKRTMEALRNFNDRMPIYELGGEATGERPEDWADVIKAEPNTLDAE